MRLFACLLIALPALLGSASSSGDAPALLLSSSTPAVNIGLRASDRYSIRLPGLQYEFQFDLGCDAGYEPDSVMLSVADTRKRFAISATEVESSDGIAMKIPATQIAPLSVEGFCLTSNNDNRREDEQITVRGILSAQASLLCSGEEGQQLTYASQSLDVTLSCVVDIAELETN
jgi:hypothetical protein